MHNNKLPSLEEYQEALKALWQMSSEMEIVLAGLAAEREASYSTVRIEKEAGRSGEWVLGEMMGIDRVIAQLAYVDVKEPLA